MSVTLGSRAVEQGDVVVVSGRRVGEPTRIGEVVEVLGQPDHPHYAVRWDDGHQSILYPGKATSIERQSAGARATPDVAATTKLLIETLRSADVEFELLPHRRTTSAAAEARALGVLAQAVAKTVIALDEEGVCIRAVVPASGHLSISKLADAVSAKTVELGAVPPFGGPAGDRVVVDYTLTRLDHLVFDGGAHDTSLRVRTEDLITMTKAQVADIAAD